MATLRPSSVKVGGIRTSMTTRSSSRVGSACVNSSPSAKAPATMKPASSISLTKPSRSSTESSTMAICCGCFDKSSSSRKPGWNAQGGGGRTTLGAGDGELAAKPFDPFGNARQAMSRHQLGPTLPIINKCYHNSLLRLVGPADYSNAARGTVLDRIRKQFGNHEIDTLLHGGLNLHAWIECSRYRRWYGISFSQGSQCGCQAAILQDRRRQAAHQTAQFVQGFRRPERSLLDQASSILWIAGELALSGGEIKLQSQQLLLGAVMQVSFEFAQGSTLGGHA